MHKRFSRKANHHSGCLYTEAHPQTVAFLHENNMTHGDLLAQNMCMDVIMPSAVPFNVYYTGFHGPGRKYVLIDFDTARIHTGPGPLSRDPENVIFTCLRGH